MTPNPQDTIDAIDAKERRDEEFRQQKHGRWLTNATLALALAAQIFVWVQTDMTLGQTRDLADQGVRAEQTQYLRTQQRVAYRALLNAGRDEAAIALAVRREVASDRGARVPISGLRAAFDSCRKSVTDVVLLGPDSLEAEAREVGQVCFRVNRSLKVLLEPGAGDLAIDTARDVRKDLVTANKEFLDTARNVLQTSEID